MFVKTVYKVWCGEGIVYKNLLALFVHLRAVNSNWIDRFKAAMSVISEKVK